MGSRVPRSKTIQKLRSTVLNDRAYNNRRRSRAQRELGNEASDAALQRTPENPRWREPVDFNQLALFDTTRSREESERRSRVVETEFPIISGTKKQRERLRQSIYETGIPTDAMSNIRTTFAVQRIPSAGRASQIRGRLGNGRRYSIRDSYVTMNPNTILPGNERNRSKTVAHELGHVAELRATNTVGTSEDRSSFNRDWSASASGEGFAEGIGMRFDARSRPPEGPEDAAHTWWRSYSPSNWDDPEHQASFVAHRALGWATGERPNAPSGTTAERVHVAGANPHVRDAIKASGLSSVARRLSDQFMSTKHVGTQLSLLGPSHDQELYSVPDVDWGVESPPKTTVYDQEREQ